MKNIVILLVCALFLSCNSKTYEDAKKVKVGMSTNELKYIMGEPWDIEINNNYDELWFLYDSGSHRNNLKVIIVNNKVYDFESY